MQQEKSKAQKRAELRSRDAYKKYGIVAALAVLLFLGLKFYFKQKDQPFFTFYSGIGFLASLIGFYYTMKALVANAVETNAKLKSDWPLDGFALCILAQLGSLYSGWFWLLLFIIPVMAVKNIISSFGPLKQQLEGLMQGQALAQTKAGKGTTSGTGGRDNSKSRRRK